MTCIRIGGIYRHKKTGRLYEAEGLMKLQIGKETLCRIVPGLQVEYAAQICAALERVSFISYSAQEDDSICGRPETEFLDGRFEDVTPRLGFFLRKFDGEVWYYKRGVGKKDCWKKDAQEASLYESRDFAERDRAEGFTALERRRIEVVVGGAGAGVPGTW